MTNHCGILRLPFGAIKVGLRVAGQAKCYQVVRRTIHFVVVDMMYRKFISCFAVLALLVVAFMNFCSKFWCPLRGIWQKGSSINPAWGIWTSWALSLISTFATTILGVFIMTGSNVVFLSTDGTILKFACFAVFAIALLATELIWHCRISYTERLATHFANSMSSSFFFGNAASPATKAVAFIKLTLGHLEFLATPSTSRGYSISVGKISTLSRAINMIAFSFFDIVLKLFATLVALGDFLSRTIAAAPSSCIAFHTAILAFAARLGLKFRSAPLAQINHLLYSCNSNWCICIIHPRGKHGKFAFAR